ncbi:MAG: DUF3151 family protein [Actinomycetota bacterium]|jgi:hypothetical protein|nr:DUF3151 family protein [Actinomycetota bacterium]
MSTHPVSLTAGDPETVLPAIAPDLRDELARASSTEEPEARLRSLRAVAAKWPGCLNIWALLAREERTPVVRYAYARVGYHRGLDALRAAGWKGSGRVRWEHVENRGFLSSLDALRRAAAELGEVEEAERCELFLRQLDPDWHSTDPARPQVR